MTARIGVVGGGLAGIAAALGAADGGAEVVLFERRATLGGLTSSVRRNGLSFDNGQHVFLRCCTAYRDLLGRIGAGDMVRLQPRLDLPVIAPGGRSASIKRTSAPPPLHLALSLAGYGHLSLRERAGFLRPVLALGGLDPGDPLLDDVYFSDWLARYGQSERAVERLWNLIALPTLNLPAGDASLGLAAMVFRVGLLDSADAGDIGWSKVPLARLHGEAARRALESSGVEVVLGSQVSALSESGGGFSVRAGEREELFDAVVVATPLRVAAALGAYGRAEDLERLGASPIVNVHLVLDRRVTELPMAACVGSPVQFVFDRTDSSGLRTGQCLSISLSAADDYIGRGSSELVAFFLEALGELFPPARSARLVDALVTRERTATFRAAPGTRVLRPPVETEVPGIFLAGATCDTGWPATMEGAVRSGQAAAEKALALLSRPSREDRLELEGAGT